MSPGAGIAAGVLAAVFCLCLWWVHGRRDEIDRLLDRPAGKGLGGAFGLLFRVDLAKLPLAQAAAVRGAAACLLLAVLILAGMLAQPDLSVRWARAAP